MRPPRLAIAPALIALIVLPSMTVAAAPFGDDDAPPRTSTFAVIGDIPYGELQLANFPYVVDQINADADVEWVAHLGDIKAGNQRCDDSYFDRVRAEFDRFVDALVFTPGDNEWTDCHRVNNGAYDPLERLAKLRQTFFPVPNLTLGQNPERVRSQARRGFPENVRFGGDDASYAAIHIVGSNNGLAPWTGNTAATPAQLAEVQARTRNALTMINQAFDEVEDDGLVVLMIQADMFDPTDTTPTFAEYSGFQPIVQRIASQSRDHDGEVLLLVGDSHGFVVDNPLAAGSPWLSLYGVRRPVPNLTRITVEGSTPVDEWLKVTVDERVGSFTYERVPIAPTPVTHVKVNEAESQAGTPGDWAELVNLSGVELDLSGYVIRDNDDSRAAVLPAGTVIPANGYYVVEESLLGFGLGGADSVRFFARDGVTLLDSVTWTEHAASTVGRCPDGAGAFGVTSSSTKGATNDCRALIGINEVESSGGVPGDWTELYNPGPSASDISGWTFRDNDDTRVPYVIPADTVVPAGGYYVIEEASQGFGLGSADSARLFRADGTLHDSYSWTAHAVTSYGRCPNFIGEFRETLAVTKGAANACEPPVTTVKINEVESSGGVPGDWAELVNTGAAPVDLTGWSFSDNSASTYAIPTGTVIPAGGFLVLDEAQFVFGLGSGDTAELFRADGSPADSYTWTAHAAVTYGRCPDGTGAFVTTTAATKGAANACPLPPIVLNEVESNPEDWVEVLNTGIAPVDISGWLFRDNDPLRVTAPYVIPAGTVVQPGQFFVIEGFGFGLGSADSATLSDATDRQVFTASWTAHASTTLGRCPDGTGEIVVTLTGTKGAANACGSPVRINEVESAAGAGGGPGDWVELINPSSAPADVSGFLVRDANAAPEYVLPAGTVIAPNGYLVIEEATLGFAFDSADSVSLLGPGGGSEVDSYTWTADAVQTFGRCPDGSGPFADTVEPTKGGQNFCVGIPFFGPWPGGTAVTAVDPPAAFTSNLSGLDYQAAAGAAPAALWAVVNGPGTLHKLTFDGSTWAPDAADGWSTGKPLRYPDGSGDVDAEGVTLGAGAGSAYVGAERNNAANGVSRNSVLLYDTASTTAGPLTATREWDVTAALPATGPNTGIEAVTFVPDASLVADGFVDATTGAAYDPAAYPNNGGGLFFVGVEATGGVYAFELDHSDGTFTLIATIASGFPGVMALEFDAELGRLWVVCDDTCLGRSSTFEIGATGTFGPVRSYERPTGMPNINNEGFTITPLSECTGGVRPVFWSDDSDTGGNSLRTGTLACPTPI